MNEHADSLGKSNDCQVGRPSIYSEILRPKSEIKEIIASPIGPCVSTATAEIRRLQTVQHISETFFQQLVRQRLQLIDWRLSRTGPRSLSAELLNDF